MQMSLALLPPSHVQKDTLSDCMQAFHAYRAIPEATLTELAALFASPVLVVPIIHSVAASLLLHVYLPLPASMLMTLAAFLQNHVSLARLTPLRGLRIQAVVYHAVQGHSRPLLGLQNAHSVPAGISRLLQVQSMQVLALRYHLDIMLICLA